MSKKNLNQRTFIKRKGGMGMIYVFRTCSVCGEPISWERLSVFPETRCCVKCAEEYGSDVNFSNPVIGMDKKTYKDLLGAVRS